MQTNQKDLKAIDTFICDVAAKIFCPYEKSREIARKTVRTKLHSGTAAVLKRGGITLCGILCGMATAFFGTSPFAAAFLCAADTFLPLAVLGCAVGALIGGRALLAFVCLLLGFGRIVTLRCIGGESDRVRSAEAAGAQTLFCLLTLITDRADPSAIVRTVCDIALAAIFAHLFRALFCDGKRYGAQYEGGIFLAVYALSCAIDGIRLFSSVPAYLVGIIAVSWIARTGGGARGCVAGLLWGIAGKATYAPAFALAGLICGRAAGDVLGVGGGALAAMLYAAFTGGFPAIRYFMPEIAIGSLLYAPLRRLGLLPQIDLFGAQCGKDDESGQAESERVRANAIQARLDAAAGALQAISAIYRSSAPEHSAAGSADDAQALSLLIKKTLSSDCGAQNDPDTAEKCRRALAATNFRCKSVNCTGSTRRQITALGVSRASLGIDPEAIRRRLSNMTGLSLSAPEFTVEKSSARMTLHSMPTIGAAFTARSAHKKGESVCGDAFTSFCSRSSLFFAILCDGMGSGRDAAAAARTACVFLEKMLEGDNSPATTLEMLNLFLRGKGYEAFTTVDILTVDTYLGKGSLIKGGSAPSYLIQGGNLFTLCAPSTPVGIIRELGAQKVDFDVRPGDRIVLASDGIADSDSPLAKEILTPGTSQSADSLCERIMHLSRVRSGRDDATVCVIDIKAL